ncbi:MAG: dihydrofolate reductase family protein [bacterium]|nr:dihydrofolate reductase family protein [bacterium]
MIKAFIIVAHTVDGFIAPESVQGQSVASTVWTSGADKKKFVELTKKAGVIVMGLNTYNTIGRALPNRLNVVYAPAGTPQIAGVEMTAKSPIDLLKDLEARGFSEVAICGGSTIYTMFMEAGLIDKIYITVEPHLFGRGLTIFNKPLDIKLSLVKSENLSSDVLFLEYKIGK